MNILKAIILVCLITGSALTGCNNESLSPVSSQGASDESIVTDKASPDKQINVSIRVKPFRSYTLDYYTTGLRLIRSLKSANCKDLTNKVEITGFGNEEFPIYVCGSKFQAKSIVIQNKTSEFVDMELTLFGEK